MVVKWLRVTANGPAIKVGCVTRRKHRAESWYPASGRARNLSRCKEGMAHFLPSGYKFNWVQARSRYKFGRSREFIPGYKAGGGHWRSVAFTKCLGARNLSRCRVLIAGRCAYPGLAAITNLSYVQEQKQKV